MADTSAVTEVSLAELQPESCGIGEWTLRVHGEPRVLQYEYQQAGNIRSGAKLECTLISTDPPMSCPGMARRGGPKGKAQFQRAAEAFKSGTIWKSSKITVAKEKPIYVSAPAKP